jgi:hypothetical protein
MKDDHPVEVRIRLSDPRKMPDIRLRRGRDGEWRELRELAVDRRTGKEGS